MVETRRIRDAYDQYDEEQLQRALRMSLVDSGHLKKRKTVQTTLKQTMGKVTKPRASPKKSVTKLNSLAKKTTSNFENGKLKLTGIKYEAFPYEMMRKWQAQGTVKPPRLPSDYWPYPDNPGIKLGHNSWKHLNWKGPSEQDVRHVNEVLDQRHAEFEHKSYVDMPAHAAQSVVNVDVCIQTIFAQSTGNEIAIDTHCRLRNSFTYETGGGRVAGKIPNWHTIFSLQQEELEQFLKSGGFHEVRARAIKEFLSMVYETNLRRERAGIQKYEHEGNPPGATDFVPGRLSLDFLLVEGDNSTEAILGRLLSLPQIGLKSAMCILAFAMKRECFPVDVHVLRYSKWLGWLPKDCDDPKKAALFLHGCVPGSIMFNLHQAIWIHCANENTRVSDSRDAICLVCGSIPPPKGTDIEQALRDCPLTDLLPPLEKRWKRYKPEMKKEEQVESKEDTGMADIEDIRSQVVKHEVDSDSEETLVNSDTASSISTPRRGTPHLVNHEDEKLPSASPNKKKAKRLNFDKLVSARFEDVPEDRVEEIQEAGFLLWEFRPMDNSFMEEYGKVEKFPRYKWERPDIMDPDAAVTVAYAKEVLAGRRRHKWSAVDAEDIAVAQAIGAING